MDLPIPTPTTASSNYAALSAMITPAIFLTAAGSLIISTSNRMSRVVDRVRTLNDLGDSMHRGDSHLDFPEERLAHVDDQVRRLLWRTDRVRHTLAMLYVAFAAFVGASLTLAIGHLASHSQEIGVVATLLSVAGVGLMLVASINLVREATAALASNHREIEFYRGLRDRRAARSSADPVA